MIGNRYAKLFLSIFIAQVGSLLLVVDFSNALSMQRSLIPTSDKAVNTAESILAGNVCKFLDRAGIDLDDVESVEPLDYNGYCNKVYRVNVKTNDEQQHVTYVSKLYSNAAKIRLGCLSNDEDVDRLASDMNIGPKVFFKDSDGIVMDFVEGVTLTVDQVHGIDNLDLCQKIARCVARLHSIECDRSNGNVLWMTLDKMLNKINDLPSEEFPGTWSIQKLKSEVSSMKNMIKSLHLQEVMCHGDLKPSNLLLTPKHNLAVFEEGESVIMIDFELSGLNYRGFDVCKLFRTSKTCEHSRNSFEAFAKSYLRYIEENRPLLGQDEKLQKNSVKGLVLEARLFEPITVSV